MKKNLAALAMASLYLLLVYSSVHAGDPVEKKIIISAPLKLQIYEDAKPTDKYIVGTVLITDMHGETEIFWDNVLISPLHSQKIVLLKPEHAYSRYDLFEDIAVGQDIFSFTMVIGPQANRICISGRKNSDDLYHTIKGEGIFRGIYAGDRPVKVEWKQVKQVSLPYRDVY